MQNRHQTKQLNQRARFVFLRDDHRRLAIPGGEISPSSIQQRESCVLSGIGRTAMSQIKNAPDTPFSLGKCTLQRLDAWLAKTPGFKQE